MCTRSLISQSIKTKEAPHHSPHLQHRRKREPHPEDTGRFHPCREVWCSLQQGLRNTAASTCVFDDAAGIYFMYMFTVTICRRKNQNHSSLLTFSKTSYRKKPKLILQAIWPLTSNVFVHLEIGGCCYLQGQITQLFPNFIFSQPSVSLIYTIGILEGFTDE